jgi:transcription-repair coupling factor (superfamily II helicase)
MNDISCAQIILKNLNSLQLNHINLIVCDTQKEAEQLHLDLCFYLGDKQPIYLFPDWEILPYDDFSPHQDIISSRLTLLHELLQKKPMCLIANINTLLYRVCPPDYLNQHIFKIKVGQHLPFLNFKTYLVQAQYRLVGEVYEHGDFAVRGSLMDVFPMGSDYPIRIEWFDDEIESIRQFDIQTQLTTQKIKELNLLPSKEFAFDESARTLFRQQFRQITQINPSLCAIYENVSSGQIQQGLENYLPLFFNQTASIFDYLPQSARVISISDLKPQTERFWNEIITRYEQRRHDIHKPILPPEQLFLTGEYWFKQLTTCQHTVLKKTPSISPLPLLKIERQKTKPLHRLKNYIDEHLDKKILLMAASIGKREVLNDLCTSSDIYPEIFTSFQAFLDSKENLGLIHSPFIEQIDFPELNLQCITEYELLGEHIVFQKESARKKSNQHTDKFIRDLSELNTGMPVVHVDFGIGRYEGLQTFDHQGILNEFLIISYAGNDKIYVPVTNLKAISKYTGASAASVSLHRLGSDHWQKEKKKAAEKIHDVAIELLETQAKRHAQVGFSCHLDVGEYERFASGFRFDETEDQKQAIHAIMQDLQSQQPMDRLICGDVGFGKTEVAMRAAFIVVQNHRQVVVLVPTTLLAKQHFETFQERFADFPIQVELLSRFRTKKESTGVLEQLKKGNVDILIGTHKLLQQDVEFKQLGLLIIDEEHRFGVKQKEHLKRIRHQADILSLTATPIPRTLNMAMHGMRDISLITTPPAKRLAIKTFWHEKNPSLIREAVLREVLRGGQVYYLHNDVATIEKTCEELKKLIPEAKIDFAHGQMHERRLEQIMADFYHQRFNVLVCTTIIETGIDIPTANTIILERADQLGLAQMHQLRGRVGRSHHQAYCYLLSPPEKSLPADSVKRLEAIVSLENLGAGFSLAMHDMEIRGAGELLGEDQSGNMHSIGFSLYMEMLEQAIEDIKAGRMPDFDKHQQQQCDMELKICAIIPDDYIPDVHQRLVFYKRISHVENEKNLHALQIELIDRFGLLPEPVKNLVASMLLKLRCIDIGITKLHLSPTLGILEFNAQPKVDGFKIIQLIQQQPQIFKLHQQQRLQFKLIESQTAIEKLHFVGDLIEQLRATPP